MKRLGLMVAIATLYAPAALACGGFFCSQVPVDQVGEHILFAVDGTDITAHIQIQYQGEAEKFSWVVPVPTQPTLTVGSDVLFQRLRSQTDPRFEIEWLNQDECQVTNQCQFEVPEADGGGGGEGGGGGVVVLDAGEVGPFTYEVVKSDDGNALFDWLNLNGYDQPEESKPLVQHYVNQSCVFTALRLQKGKDAGDLQPIVLKYVSETLACVPLKLTSIAAADDMPVFTWTLAKARAVPMNYFHVLLNPKAYDWLSCATPKDSWWGGGWPGQKDCQKEYMDLVTAAANQANGHAFVTEFAGDSAIMKDQLYTEGQFDTESLKTAETPGEFLQQLMGMGIPQGPLTQQLIRAAIPKPTEGLSEDCKEDSQFYAMWNIDDCIKYMPETWTFDPVAFADDVEARIVTPMRKAQALFTTHTYLTRMFTTVSPDEMTKDPIFSFNPDLPGVDNIHTIQAKATCKEGSKSEAESVTLIYPDGTEETVKGTFQDCGPWLPEEGDGGGSTEPPVADIQILGESGGPESVHPDDVDTKEAGLETRAPSPEAAAWIANPTLDILNTGTFATEPVKAPEPEDNLNEPPAAEQPPLTKEADGCSTSGHGSSPAWVLVLMGLAVLMRRRSAQFVGAKAS